MTGDKRDGILYTEKGIEVDKQMAVTIADVAKEANVSISTISRVVNNSKTVSPELKEHVFKVIERTGYRPNVLARGLITKQTQTIGLVVSDISNPVIATVAKGINSVCQERGYTVVVCETDGKAERETELLNKLAEHRIDGLVFAGVDVNHKLTEHMLRMEYPVVLVTQQESYGETRVDTVIHDNYHLTYDAVSFLIANGHRRIAFIAGPKNDYSSGMLRIEGYHAALKEHSIPPTESYVRYGDFSFDAGYESMRQIYEESLELPTAVIAASDLMAIGAMQSAFSLGLSVPEDLSVMGIDDSEMAKYSRPSLSTVRIPYFEEGALAGETLFRLIEERREEKTGTQMPTIEYVKHRIIRRASVGRVKT